MRRFRDLIASTLSIAIVTACSGSGGFAPLTPGAVSAPTASASAKPSPTASPTPAQSSGPVLGSPTFTGGGSGNCTTGIYFTAEGQSATIPLSEPNYTGSFTAASSSSAVATASVNGGALTVTAVSAGTAFITITDSANRTQGCNISVTITSGTVS